MRVGAAALSQVSIRKSYRNPAKSAERLVLCYLTPEVSKNGGKSPVDAPVIHS
jgi:hypothetical protein